MKINYATVSSRVFSPWRPSRAQTDTPNRPSRVALYLPHLDGGGVEMSMLRLAQGLTERGYDIDLVLDSKRGFCITRIPSSLRVFELARGSKFLARLALLRAYPYDCIQLLAPALRLRKPYLTLRRLPSLVRYLTQQRPVAIVTALDYTPFFAIWATRIARADTAVIVTERTIVSKMIAQYSNTVKNARRRNHKRVLVGQLYPRADAIVAISNGVADDLVQTAGLERSAISVIYNPVVSDNLARLAAQPCGHPWFNDKETAPVILAVGRLAPEKDFSLLIEAFAKLRRIRPARLLIIGDGPQRALLQSKVDALKLGEDVALPGWSDNPYPFMRNASVLVVSSVYEGLGNTLIEAMACGCPVAAMDCPSGPREILADGRYGRLVPVRDASALAHAIIETLANPLETRMLQQRAADFSVESSVDQYQKLIETLRTKKIAAAGPCVTNNEYTPRVAKINKIDDANPTFW